MTATATGVAFVWLGMVLAISFLETPLKFLTPGVDLGVGLAIGRLVFRALNTVEILLAIVLLTCVLSAAPHGARNAAITGVVILIVQVSALRPRLTRRTNQILAGADASRSRSHHAYIALEAGKVFALLVTGTLLLTTT
jgi:hypothetical protein